jgi:hypothetical protein
MSRINAAFAWITAATVICLTLAPAVARAQQGAAVMATIHGTVTDEQGGVMPGVTVTLRSPAIQGQTRTEVTAADGTFRFSNLFNGVYDITYQLEGFATISRPGQQLPAGFVMRLDAALKVGSIGETIQVTAAAPVVDTTSTSSTYNLAAETIREMPVGRGLWELLTMAPGVSVAGEPDVGDSRMGNRSDISTYGVASTTTIAVEGVNTSIGPSSAVYQLSFSVDEVQIKTSGQTADVMSPGMNFQAVLKSGSNSVKGNYQLSYENPAMQANNIDDRLRAQGITVTEPLEYYYDFGVDLGGPIVRDKLWYYGAFSRQQRLGTQLGFNQRELSRERGPDGRFFIFNDDQIATAMKRVQTLSLKMTWQATPKNRVLVVTQPTLKYEPQRNGTNLRSLGSTVDYRNPGWTHKVELQSALSNRALFNVNVGYGGYSADYSANRSIFARPGNPSITDSRTGFIFGASAQAAQRPDTRANVSASLSLFPEKELKFLPGKHELKVGGEYLYEMAGSGTEDNGTRHGNYLITTDSCLVDPANVNLWRFTTNANTGLQVPTCGAQTVAQGGMPFTMRQIAFRSAWPNIPKNIMEVYSAFITDTWRLNRGITVNWGVRFDRQHPYVPEQGNDPNIYYPELFPGGYFDKVDNVGLWNDVVPRLGIAWDINGDGRNVVKGTWGLFAQKVDNGYAGDWNLNTGKTATFRFRDVDGNRDYTPGIGEVNLAVNGPDFVSISGTGTLPPVNHDLRTERTAEVTASFERELMRNIGFRAQWVHKREYDVQASYNPNRPYEVYNQQFTRRDPGPDNFLDTADDPIENGQPRMVTFYDFDPAYIGPQFNSTITVNREINNPYWNTYEFALAKRMSGRWSAQTSVWWTQNHVYRNAFMTTPNDEIFPLNFSWIWAANFTGSYILPGDVLVSAYYQGKTGVLGQRTYAFQQVDPDGGPSLPSSTSISIPMEEAGSQRGPAINTINFRASKQFRLRTSQVLHLDFDVFNIRNVATPTGITYASGPNWGRITDILPARIARVGARFTF